MIKRLIPLFMALSLLSPWYASTAQAAKAPAVLVDETMQQMIAALRGKQAELRADQDKLYALVQEIILPHFDFKRMSALVLGPNWRKATPQQRDRFVEEFRALIVRTYAKSLLEYTDEEITLKPVRGNPQAKRVTVPTVVKSPSGGQEIPIDYDMYKPAEAWLVYDVKIDNVSLVVNYKNSYADIIRKSGMDELLQQMADKASHASSE